MIIIVGVGWQHGIRLLHQPQHALRLPSRSSIVSALPLLAKLWTEPPVRVGFVSQDNQKGVRDTG